MSKSKAPKTVQRKRKLINRQRRIRYRLRDRQWEDQPEPMFKASNIHYELSDRVRGLDCGGIGAFHLLARRVGLTEAIDRRLHLLKLHLPYHESDHVLNMAYNILTGGTCLEHIELRRNDEVYLDGLAAQRIPDPTTAGGFCRRLEPQHVEMLMEAINEVRLNVWREQPEEFFEEAIIDVDGLLAATTGECKFDYTPTHCQEFYTIIVVGKNLSVEKGEQVLFDDIRYFFYITNDQPTPAEELVPLANGRCNQENLIEQLKNGVHAMRMPTGDLVSNWAYMVMASLAWTLKA